MTWDIYQPCIDSGACPDLEQLGGDAGWGKGSRPVIEAASVPIGGSASDLIHTCPMHPEIR